MKVEPASLRQFAGGNVYEACDDTFLVDSVLDESAVLNSRHHEFHLENGAKNIVLDKSAPDYDNMIVSKGQPVAADELLEALKPLALKIPLRARLEFQDGQLPLLELLMAIQYYASHTNLKENLLNESALLAFGMLVEQWADEMVDDNTARMFLELDLDEDNGNYAPESDTENEGVMENWTVDDSDSDVMSVDLEESETDEEFDQNGITDASEAILVPGTKRKLSRTPELRKRKSRSASDTLSSDSGSDSSSDSGSDSSSDSSSDSGSNSSSDSGPQENHQSSSGASSGSESEDIESVSKASVDSDDSSSESSSS